jgi:2-methylcitrate dehydratase PrpD
LAKKIGQYAAALRYVHLPESVVQEVKNRTLDLIGVSLPAWREKPAQILISYALKIEGNADASILLHKTRVPAATAALVNGTMGHCLEIDDDHNQLVGHPGVTAIPACLAAAEKAGTSGREYIVSVVLAYQLTCSLGQAITSGTLHDQGWHPTGICGTFGAALGAAKALNLDTDQIVCALGIAGSQTSGLFEYQTDGTWTKRLHGGWSAHNGVLAAILAKGGLTGPASVLEGRFGFLHAFAKRGNYDPQLLERAFFSGLYEIEKTSYKPYACCRDTHPGIDVTLDVIEANEIEPTSIKSIQIFLHQEALPIVASPAERRYRPQTTVDAQFSIYYAVAAAILSRERRETMTTFLAQFTEEMIKDQGILDLAARITCTADLELNAMFPEFYGAKVELTTYDGKIYKHFRQAHRGDQSIGAEKFSYTQLEQRFMSLTESVLEREQAKKAVETIDRLENLDSLTEFMRMLSVPKKGGR